MYLRRQNAAEECSIFWNAEGEKMLDIEYLLLLQRFRELIHDALTPFMEWISLFAVTYLVLIPVMYYWGCSKKKGLYVMGAYCYTVAVNAVVKLTACVYRPWIRDSRVVPAGDAIRTATGYSFPSGHTSTAGPIGGGLAVSLKKEKKPLSVLCMIFVLIVAFSRNYLGVHTPQDVLAALLESFIVLYLMRRAMTYLGEHPEKENSFLLITLIMCVLAILYITYKPYPMVYIGEKLLVDPQKMMTDGFGDIAKLIGFIAGRYVEKTWIHFEETGLTGKKSVPAWVGAAVMAAIIKWGKGLLTPVFGAHWGSFVNSFIRIFFAIAVWPLVIKLLNREKA